MTKSKRALPTPMELAKLAILLPRNQNTLPADQVRIAMELYVEALLLCQECASLSFEELVMKFRNKRQVAIERGAKAREAQWRDALELNPEKESDPAREYLSKHGLCFKTARTVLSHVRTAWSMRRPDMIPDSFDILAHCKRLSSDGAIYLIPRFLLNGVVAVQRDRREKIQSRSRAVRRASKVVK